MSGYDLDRQLLERLIGLARNGDVRGVLGLSADADPQTFHLTDPVLKHLYESLLARNWWRGISVSPPRRRRVDRRVGHH
ncbi:hypothetical protein [Streptomyces sp. NPDC006510]|uniref:hypothetical protein n=1 Tax=Streptomyces sp. NPDC006510 TaxID=3155600 RepID=UPI0033B30745